jgi:hypothetical protein
MVHGTGLRIDPPTVESFLAFQGVSEAKLLRKQPLADLPEDAWRILWEGLAVAFRNMIADFFASYPSTRTSALPVQIAPGWYWGDQTPSMNLWRITRGGQEYCFIGEEATINKLLDDLHLVPWRVWHVICNIDSMREFWRSEETTFTPPTQERLTSLEAYTRIKGWLLFQYMKEE